MLGLIIVAVLLSACNPEQAERIVVRCGHLAGMTSAEQLRAAAELRRLPAGSVIAETIVPDWIRMRDEARACARS